MDDIYSWILSPEIREHLREHYHPGLPEKQALRFDLKPLDGAYRTTEFYLYDALLRQAGLTREEWERGFGPEELPAGLEILGEIGARLRCLNRRNWTAAKDQFLQIFVQRRKKAGRTSAD